MPASPWPTSKRSSCRRSGIFSAPSIPSLASAARAYLEGLKHPPRHGAIAVAAPSGRRRDQAHQFALVLHREESFAALLGLDGVLVLNDFQALALSLRISGARTSCIGSAAASLPRRSQSRARAGHRRSASRVSSGAGRDWVAVPSEGGHISLAAHSRASSSLRGGSVPGAHHLSVERVLSGPGLADLYRAIAESHGKPPNRSAPTMC